MVSNVKFNYNQQSRSQVTPLHPVMTVVIRHREPKLLFISCKWKLNNLFCSILESAAVRSEMGVVLRCEGDVQVDALTVVDFIMLYVVCLAFFCWCHAVVIHCWLLIY